MIYAIETKNPFKYISGISEDQQIITEYLNSLPSKIKSNSKLLEFKALNYPFWLLENSAFQFLTDEKVLRALEKAGDKLKDEEDVFNLYLIAQEHLADEGRDEMGILKHSHFDREKCKEINKKGLKFLESLF